jgi:hemerythrin superfamily protein
MTELGTASPPDHADDQDVIDVLTTDHREAVSLISQIRSTADPEQRRDLADQLIAELVRHSVAEEMFVYPAMRDHLPGGAEAVEHDIAEHKELERVMKQLEGTDSSGPEFLSVVDSIESILADHVSDEEAEQFPQLRTHVPQEQLVELKARWRRPRRSPRPVRTRCRRTPSCSTRRSVPVSGWSTGCGTSSPGGAPDRLSERPPRLPWTH